MNKNLTKTQKFIISNVVEGMASIFSDLNNAEDYESLKLKMSNINDSLSTEDWSKDFEELCVKVELELKK